MGDSDSFGSVISLFLNVLGAVRQYAAAFAEQANLDFEGIQDGYSARKVAMCYDLYGRSEILRLSVEEGHSSFARKTIRLSLRGRTSMVKKLQFLVKSVRGA